MRWHKDCNGWYVSNDDRFLIHDDYDEKRKYHWVLIDTKLLNELREKKDMFAYAKAQYHCETLKEAKAMAKAIKED